MKSLEDRFWEKVQKLDACWLWTASTIGGYGQIGWHVNKKQIRTYAHRFSWELHNGPIPEGLYVCHICDVKRCVNPDHLFLGTQKDNMADCVSKGRQARGEKVAGAKLTKADVIAIRGSSTDLKETAKEFGVCVASISLIRNLKTWKHI